MQFYSLSKVYKKSFKEAVLEGIAPDKSLYFPSLLPKIDQDFWEKISSLTNEEIGFQLIKPFIGNDIPDEKLREIISKTLSFDFPVIHITRNLYSLELFHGPTLAFKDVGARFMAECLSYFNQDTDKESTVLVATSGDTGGAVANGFYKTKGVKVVILYPSKKVTDIQERQLTTLGENITAIEIDGSFDDCQDIVKKAFLDDDLNKINLTSANSINIARWLPQMIYYALAYKQLKHHNKELIISCPSGNFGNICAGIVAKKMGLPIKQFIASTNANDTIPRYLLTKRYEPTPTTPTLSNAMDISNPSNFVRIEELYNHNFEHLKNDFYSYSFTDNETKAMMKFIYKNYNYITEPHGAIGYLGLLKHLKQNDNYIGVFAETAHPIKFLNTVEKTLNIELTIPEEIEDLLNKEKRAFKISKYEEIKQFLLDLK
ncbi:threonine synthase [Flavobacterium oreochromis]|uniref:threonine synthase n=1 Tax=Flavobacterium oreochromis TaxID=2906078 RepID=UPI000CDACD73|nr:threonine synthase [Flavobacterium columnare]